jgi:hypothetical protein
VSQLIHYGVTTGEFVPWNYPIVHPEIGS